ncbi:MAG: response regulator [Acidimicrobiales bacterium]
MRILVVEDQPRLAAAIERGLEAEGFAVDVANDGEDGLRPARQHPYDAIVLNILLSKLNGCRVC